MERKDANWRLTFWILLLSFANGFANVVAILSYWWPVSHVTGLTSQLAIAMAQGQTDVAILLLKGFFLFFLGATFSGILFHQRQFRLEKRYGILLFIGGLIIFFLRGSDYLHLFLFFYMGLINTMFILYKGILVRTTHITGYLTDAGFELGTILRGGKYKIWRLAFYLGSIALFFAGGYTASLLMDYAGLILSGLYLFLGAYYFLLRQKSN